MKDFSRLVPLICGFLAVIDNVFVLARKSCDVHSLAMLPGLVARAAVSDCYSL